MINTSRLYYLIALCFALSLKTYAQRKSPENGLNFRFGINSILVDQEEGDLFGYSRMGYTVGADILLHDDILIIHPGLHLLFLPQAPTDFNKVWGVSKRAEKIDLALKLPVRLSFYLINLDGFRIRGGGGLFLIWNEDFVTPFNNIDKYKIRATSGWNLNAGIVLLPLTFDLDLESTFGSQNNPSRYNMRALTATVGILF